MPSCIRLLSSLLILATFAEACRPLCSRRLGKNAQRIYSSRGEPPASLGSVCIHRERSCSPRRFGKRERRGLVPPLFLHQQSPRRATQAAVKWEWEDRLSPSIVKSKTLASDRLKRISDPEQISSHFRAALSHSSGGRSKLEAARTASRATID